MTTVIVLFNLKPGVSVADYERFARETDLPIVNKLPSVNHFEVLRSTGLLGGGNAPFQYIEILRLKSLEAIGNDVSSDTMKRVAAEFRKLADNPQFILTESVGAQQ